MDADQIISRLSTKMEAIPYLQKSYGRAMVFKENVGDHGLMSYPKVHVGNDDYENCLPNDTYIAQSYFIATGGEKYGEFDRFTIGEISRQFAFTFWGNMKRGNFTLEQAKFEAIRILQGDGAVRSIDSYVDERYDWVFPEFTIWINRSSGKDSDKKEADTNWLMYPNSGFRLLFTIAYTQPC